MKFIKYIIKYFIPEKDVVDYQKDINHALNNPKMIYGFIGIDESNYIIKSDEYGLYIEAPNLDNYLVDDWFSGLFTSKPSRINLIIKTCDCFFQYGISGRLKLDTNAEIMSGNCKNGSDRKLIYFKLVDITSIIKYSTNVYIK